MNKDYFQRATAALREAGLHHPLLFIDRDKLDDNIDVILKGLAKGPALRIVDKSLPSVPLMRHIMAGCQTARVMSFHLPMALSVLEAFPQVDILFGKPMPVAALSSCLRTATAYVIQDLFRRSVFLIDTFTRLEQYSNLASQSGLSVRIAFEVDVGMHRGGFRNTKMLASAVERVSLMPELKIEGLMAYDAHIPQLPVFAGRARERSFVDARLAEFVKILPQNARRIINTGGSKTAFSHHPQGVATEVSIGSAFVKPADFDVANLSSLQPAAFIATPILKIGDAHLPGPSVLTATMQRLRLFPKRSCFLYGGNWMAEPVYPASMKENWLWGKSSNQQMMALHKHSTDKVDDFAFFRPTQSEAVLQSMDGLYVISGGKVEERWDTIPFGTFSGI
ncbi:alanine racemase [Oryzifoliimicrobium ureilyticus]|uniref:alanine racemase n=1 Tax=Oryzifoliimicrobium ureilyticus TaxID=3113724 RepID=UPI0030765537